MRGDVQWRIGCGGTVWGGEISGQTVKELPTGKSGGWEQNDSEDHKNSWRSGGSLPLQKEYVPPH